MQKHLTRSALILLILALVVACDTVNPQSSTAVPTRTLSAPLIEATQALQINPLTRVAPNVTPMTSGVTSPTLAGLPADAQVPPVAVTASSDNTQTGIGGQSVLIPMPDGTQLFGTTFEAQIPDLNAPALPDGSQPLLRVGGVLLLGGDVSEWNDFAVQLRVAGFSVLHMNLPPNGGTVEDFSAMLTALSEMGTVNPARIAVIGAGLGADVGLIGCSLNQLCDTMILLSPQSRDTLLNVMITYNPRPLMLSASRDDASFNVAQALQNVATGEVLFQPYDNAGVGTSLLINAPDLTPTIVTWLNRVLVD